MPDDAPSETLLPTTQEELAFTLAHALRFDGRKQFTISGEMMAKITAAHLIEQLRKAGFVVMKKPPDRQHSYKSGNSAPSKGLTD